MSWQKCMPFSVTFYRYGKMEKMSKFVGSGDTENFYFYGRVKEAWKNVCGDGQGDGVPPLLPLKNYDLTPGHLNGFEFLCFRSEPWGRRRRRWIRRRRRRWIRRRRRRWIRRRRRRWIRKPKRWIRKPKRWIRKPKRWIRKPKRWIRKIRLEGILCRRRRRRYRGGRNVGGGRIRCKYE